MRNSRERKRKKSSPFSGNTAEAAPVAPRLPNVATRAVPEHDAIAASESVPDFSVLVGIRAPPLSKETPRHFQCAPIDLVMVLDVSSSMRGQKIDLVKQAVHFIINNLGPSDRISLVSFDRIARVILPLTKMTPTGRAEAQRAVDSISTADGTNILEGLRVGAEVLEQSRLVPSPVVSIMFLSDGKDSCNLNLSTRQPSEYLPPSIRTAPIPVHTFGFGSKHNPIVMHAISDSSGGTFSFVESFETLPSSFARCIGGLLSVVARELRLTTKSASNGVVIKSIPSGKHSSDISEQGSRGLIFVGDLYADEEKEFLINVSVPVYTPNEDGTTSLLDVTCCYRDAFLNETVLMDFVEIRRPGVPLPSDVKVKIEVDRQRNRLDAAEGFEEARRAAEAGDLEGAREILLRKRSAILASESGQAGDLLVVKVEKEMEETVVKMECKDKYEKSGRAYALSRISELDNQRATTSNNPSRDAYVTPHMADMVNKSMMTLVKINLYQNINLLLV